MKRFLCIITVLFIMSAKVSAFTADCSIEEWGVGDPMKLEITIITGGGKLISIIKGKKHVDKFLKKEDGWYLYATSYGVIKLGKIKNGKFRYEETIVGDGFSGSCTIR